MNAPNEHPRPQPPPGHTLGTFCSLAILILAAASAQSQRITEGHLNVGARSTEQDSQLYFANGAIFAPESGYVQMTIPDKGLYAGLFGSGPSITVLPRTVANGGPSPAAPALGSLVEIRMTLESAPAGGMFSFWDEGATSSTFSLIAGSTSRLWELSDVAAGAGLPGADPYGHIHGRRFTATEPGEYVLRFQAFDTSINGADGGRIHRPSDPLSIRFQAVVGVPESSPLALFAMGVLAIGLHHRRRRGK